VPQHRHQWDDAGPTGDEEERTGHPRPDEVAADRGTELELIKGPQLTD
jgi:hypothetical protein